MLVALLVTLIPTTIGGLLSAIGIAGMDRLIRFNVIATSGRAVEAAGDVDTLLLDKTGTITFGNRLATAFIPVPGVTEQALAEAAFLASLADETPEGRSIVALAKVELWPERCATAQAGSAKPIPFSATTRISGVDLGGRSIRKGAVDAVLKHAEACRRMLRRRPFARPSTTSRAPAARRSRSPRTARLLGVIHLKDVVKSGHQGALQRACAPWASRR